jgi:beta-lactamase regulating signal transducer with metallopeptidase domain
LPLWDGLSRWVKAAGPELQHKIWVATLILATFVPATPAIQSWFAHQALTDHVRASSPVAAVGRPGRHIPLTGSDIIFQPATLRLVSGLYIAGLLFCFLRLCWLIHRTAALVRNADAASTNPDYTALWHTSRERFSVQSAALLQTGDVSGPVTAGLWRPVLLLPATFMENHSGTEFLAAAAHECAHIKRDDLRKNVFYEIVALFTLFHPLTWFIKSQIAQTREMVCDRMASEQLADRLTYARSLLQLASKIQPATSAVSHAMGMFDARILERRIMNLTTSMPRLSRIQRYLRTVAATFLLAVCAGGIGLMTRTVAAQAPDSSAQGQPSAGEKEAAPDLACTYYSFGVASSEATCGRDPGDKTKYRCFLNADPSQSNPQSACEWKVLRFEQWKKK